MMTVLDLVMIGMGVGFFVLAKRRLQEVQMPAFLATGLGLSGFGLFYAADLFAMHVLPRWTSPAHAMAVMEDLHLNYHWGVMLIGASSVGRPGLRPLHGQCPTPRPLPRHLIIGVGPALPKSGRSATNPGTAT